MSDDRDTNRLGPNGSGAEASSEAIESLLDEVEPEPLTEQRIASIVAKAEAIGSDTTNQQMLADKPIAGMGIALSADLGKMLDDVDEEPLDDERISRILHKVEQKIDQDGRHTHGATGATGSDPERMDARSNSSASCLGGGHLKHPFGSTQEPFEAHESSVSPIHRLDLWLRSHRYPVAAAAMLAIAVPLVSIVWLSDQPSDISVSQVTLTHKWQVWDHMRGVDGHAEPLMFVLEGTTVQPQAHGRLVRDESTNKCRFYAVGLKPTNNVSIYRIWLYELGRNGNTVSEDRVDTSDLPEPGVDMEKSIVATPKGVSEAKALALGAFQVRDPNEEIDLALALPLSPQQFQSGRYWVAVTQEANGSATKPTGPVVLVGKATIAGAEASGQPSQR